jgi:outer membrane beta-barrel protein
MWGVEVMGYKMFSNDAEVLKRFKETRNATIEFNEEKYYAGASLLFTPIYAKFSFLGQKISHFDMYVAPGLGVTKTLDAHITPSIAVGQKFWITPKWNIRLEYRWLRFNDKTPTSEGITAKKNGGPGYFEDTVTDQNLIFGISYLFN